MATAIYTAPPRTDFTADGRVTVEARLVGNDFNGAQLSLRGHRAEVGGAPAVCGHHRLRLRGGGAQQRCELHRLPGASRAAAPSRWAVRSCSSRRLAAVRYLWYWGDGSPAGDAPNENHVFRHGRRVHGHAHRDRRLGWPSRLHHGHHRRTLAAWAARGRRRGPSAGRGPPRTARPSRASLTPVANPRIDELRKRLDREPGSRLFGQLAEELRKDGELVEAIRVARIGLAAHPNYPSARMTLGRALFDTGDLAAARGELELVLRGAPENILASRMLAECLEGLGDHGAALLQFRAALRLAPGDRQTETQIRSLEQRLAGAGGGRPAPPPIPAAVAATRRRAGDPEAAAARASADCGPAAAASSRRAGPARLPAAPAGCFGAAAGCSSGEPGSRPRAGGRGGSGFRRRLRDGAFLAARGLDRRRPGRRSPPASRGRSPDAPRLAPRGFARRGRGAFGRAATDRGAGVGALAFPRGAPGLPPPPPPPTPVVSAPPEPPRVTPQSPPLPAASVPIDPPRPQAPVSAAPEPKVEAVFPPPPREALDFGAPPPVSPQAPLTIAFEPAPAVDALVAEAPRPPTVGAETLAGAPAFVSPDPVFPASPLPQEPAMTHAVGRPDPERGGGREHGRLRGPVGDDPSRAPARHPRRRPRSWTSSTPSSRWPLWSTRARKARP